MQTGRNAYWGFGLSLIIAGFFLFSNLGDFGMWEPSETKRAGIAESYLDSSPKAPALGTAANLEERLVAVSWALTSKSEFMARLPIACLGLLSLVALFFVVTQLAGPPTAALSALALVSAPVFLFHAKQLTGGMPALFAEILALGGLALIAYSEDRRSLLTGGVFAAVGIAVGCLSSGLLLGVVAPLASIVLALALDGKITAIINPGAGVTKKSQVLLFLGSAMAIVAAGIYGALSLGEENGIPVLTGGSALPHSQNSYDYVLEQIAYGWFPWSSLLPLVAIGLITHLESPAREKTQHLRHLVVASLAVGYLCQTFQGHLASAGAFFHALPITLGVALVIEELEQQESPWRLAGLIAMVTFILLVRDFAQKPEVLLMGWGPEQFKLPKDFMPIYQAASFSAIFGVMILTLGFIGFRGESESRWKSWRSLIFPPLVALSFGGYISFSLVPELSMHWSSKHAIDSYARFRRGEEKLAVFKQSHFDKAATKLLSEEQAVEWLTSSTRQFLLFPKSALPGINAKLREKKGQNAFVLDAESNNLLLATSKPLPDERNASPVAESISSQPFSPPPTHDLNINFDDKLRLVGYDLNNSKGGSELLRGDELILTTYWKVEGRLLRNYDIFIHFDGPGGRFHGDHKPLDDAYPTTYWRPGDYVKDVYRRSVPVYQKAGTYHIKLGMYQGSSHRLPILNEPRANANAFFLTSVKLK